MNTAEPTTERKQEFLLTPTKVKNAEPGEHRDGVNGLVLKVTPKGRRVWYVRYRSPMQFRTMTVDGAEYRVGRDRRLPVGTYPTTSLKAARKKAREEQVRIEDGIDPMEERQAAKHAESVQELFYAWEKGHAAKKATGADMVRVLKKEIPRSWWGKPAKSITTPEVTKVLDGIAVDRPYQANKTRAYLSGMFGYGLPRGMVDVNPVTGTKLPHTPEEREGDPLTPKQIRKLWAVLTREDPIIAATYRLRLLTLQRGRQVRMMRWADVELTEDGDIGEWWNAPRGTTKTKKPHRVYLSALARRELERIRPITGGSAYVLQSPRKEDDEPIGQLQKASVRIRDKAKLPTEFARGFRRTGRSWLPSKGVSPDTCERVLGHAMRGVRKAYDDYSYDDEKKHALTLWGGRVAEILLRKRPARGKVLDMRR